MFKMPTTKLMLELGQDLGKQADVQLAVFGDEIHVSDAHNQPTPLATYLGKLCSLNHEPYVVPKPEAMAVLTLALGWSASAHREAATVPEEYQSAEEL